MSKKRFSSKASTFQQCGDEMIDLALDEKSPLREYQKTCLVNMTDKKAVRMPLIVSPTGSGKTMIIVLSPYLYLAKKVLVIAPSTVIREQIAHDFGLNGIGKSKVFSLFLNNKVVTQDELKEALPNGVEITDTSIIKKNVKVIDSELIIINAQKFVESSNLELSQFDAKSFDLVIVDEAHHFPAPTWKKIVSHFSDTAKVVFFTATPYKTKSSNRIDKMVVKDSNGKKLPSLQVVFEVKKQDLVDKGFIRDLKFEQCEDDNNPNFSIMTYIKKVLKNRPNDKALVLCRLKEECDEILKYSKEINIEAVVHYGNHDNKDYFENNSGCCVIIVCGKLLEGFDSPKISVVGICRNVKSSVIFSQVVGRAVRKPPNTNYPALLISHSKYGQKLNYDKYKDEYERGLDTLIDQFLIEEE